MEQNDNECIVCSKLLEKIKILDEQVAEATRLKDFYEFQLNYIRFTMVVKSTKDMYQQSFDQAWTNWICLKSKQQKKHLKLSKHYREDHLHG